MFRATASVGANGCGFEQHLGAMERALAAPENAEFLRADANLAVIVLADEDDCTLQDGALMFGPDSAELGIRQSFRCTRFGITCDQDLTSVGEKSGCTATGTDVVADVQPFIDNLLARKADPRQIMVAGIVGDPSVVSVQLQPPPGSTTPVMQLAHSCTWAVPIDELNPTGVSTADPAVRIASFLDAFPDRSTLTSICDSDLAGSLVDIGATAKKVIGDPCIDTTGLADADTAPGVQPTCKVADVLDAAPDIAVDVPACGGGVTSDCFELVTDAAVCPRQQDHLRVQLRRTQPVTGARTQVRCLAM